MAHVCRGMGILCFWKIEPVLKDSVPGLAQSLVVPFLFAACVGVPVAAGVLLRNSLRQRHVQAVDFSAK